MSNTSSRTGDAHVSWNQGLEEFSGTLRNFELDIRQLSHGVFNAHSTLVNLPFLRLARRTTTSKYSLSGRLPDDILFYFPLNKLSKYSNGLLITPDIQLASVGGKQVFSIVPEGYDHLVVALPELELYRFLTSQEVAQFVSLVDCIDMCSVNPARKLSITRRLFEIYTGCLRGKAQAEDSEAVCGEVVRLLYDYLLAHQGQQKKRASTQEKLLYRVLMLIENNPALQLSLDDIAERGFASKRSIQYTFDSMVGISPMRYIKLNRLNLIRKELCRCRPDTSISSIIGKYSFSNVGRTLKEYQQLFGELPRETVARRF